MPIEPIFEKAELVAAARAVVVDAFRAYVTAAEVLGAAPSKLGFITAYNAGRVKVDKQTRSHVPSLDRRTLARWLSLAESDTLKPKWVGRKSQLETRPEIGKVFDSILVERPKASAAEIVAELERRLPAQRWKPTLRTVQRYLEQRSIER